MWWKQDVVIQIKNYYQYHIDAWIGEEASSRVTLFYGSPYAQIRDRSWDQLRRLATMSTLPWLVVGDLNQVCFSWEVMGGRVSGEWQMSKFREVLRDNNLFDLGLRENIYILKPKDVFPRIYS